MSRFHALALPFLLTLACYPAWAGGKEHVTEPEQSRQVIALATHEFELAETDVSDLRTGESRTLVTDSGKTIDILRTESGLEIYLDGVLLNPQPGVDEHAMLHQEIEITCPEVGECERRVLISEDGDIHLDATGDGSHVIQHRIRVGCTDESECGALPAGVTGRHGAIVVDELDGQVHVIRLHDGQSSHGEGLPKEKVIVIRAESGRN